MDNQRPQLDLKFYKDIYLNRDGTPLRTFVTVFNASLWSFRYRSVHQIWPIPVQCRNGREWLPKSIPTWRCIWSGGETISRALPASPWWWCWIRAVGRSVQSQMPGLHADAFSAGMHIQNRRCDDLIEKTVATLNDDIIASMLLAVQRNNLDFSVRSALIRWVCQLNGQCQQQSQQNCSAYSRPGLEVKDKWEIVGGCLRAFPFIWASCDSLNLLYMPHEYDVPQLQFVSASYLLLTPFISTNSNMLGLCCLVCK